MFACPRNRAPSLAEKPLESVKHAMPDRLDTNRPDGPALSLIGGVIAMSRLTQDDMLLAARPSFYGTPIRFQASSAAIL